MERYSIAVGTITYAIKGRDLLRDLGISAHLTRKMSQNGNAGCGYSIVIEGNLTKSKSALEDAGIKIFQINKI